MSDVNFEVGSSGAHTLGSSGGRWSQVWSVGVDNSEAPAITFSSDADTGFYRSGGDTIKVVAGRLISEQDVYSLFHAGKTIKDNTQEYIDVILWLPWVNGNQLKMVETLEYFRRQLFPESDEL